MFIISGYELDINSLSDSYKLLNELDICSNFEDSVIDEIPNVKVCIYRCPKECTLEEAEQAIIDKYFGTMEIGTLIRIDLTDPKTWQETTLRY